MPPLASVVIPRRWQPCSVLSLVVTRAGGRRWEIAAREDARGILFIGVRDENGRSYPTHRTRKAAIAAALRVGHAAYLDHGKWRTVHGPGFGMAAVVGRVYDSGSGALERRSDYREPTPTA